MKPEITWSLMHPTELSVDYMRFVAERVTPQVTSFEICAACHGPLGGLDGLLDYADYPEVMASRDVPAIKHNQQRLRDVLAAAHAVNRPVYYWHREVIVPAALLKLQPELRDENGEFDLLGRAYGELLRYKIRRAFAAVPELDGIVLTLTEADFSAIHNSTPEKYPPVEVVARVAGIFAEELTKLGKRFILRSFGSVAADYQDILDGAERIADRYSFEVETKITPYDFDPFLPENPFFRPIKNLTMGAECDSLGEFLGGGYLPAENVDNIVRYVRFAQRIGVARYAIRTDRVGNNVFERYPINLYAYMRAIEDASLTADDIRREYAAQHYPESRRKELLELGKTGYELVTKLYYIAGNVIFHSFPPKPEFKWLKAGGIFSLFAEHRPLALQRGIWSILADNTAPSHAEILREKDEACRLADSGLALIEQCRGDLAPAEYARLRELWDNARMGAVCMRAFIRCVIAYVEDMNDGQTAPKKLRDASEQARAEIGVFLRQPVAKQAARNFVNGLEHSLFANKRLPIEKVFAEPLYLFPAMLEEEFRIERTMRDAVGEARDVIVAGSITDDIRCGRYMHASHAAVLDGKIVRFVGNQVFPNGFVTCEFAHGGRLEVVGKGSFLVSVNDGPSKPCEDSFALDIPDRAAVTFRKRGNQYPCLATLAVR